jgi:hypothetical protein
VLSLTFDTNCINAKGRNQALNQLEMLKQQRLIIVVSSTSVEEELLQEKDMIWREKHIDKLNEFNNLDTGFWILGLSRLGVSTKLGDASTGAEMEGMASILFPGQSWCALSENRIHDVLALHTHWAHHRDIFVTMNSKDFIGKKNAKRRQLQDQFGIAVLDPYEALEYVDHTLRNNRTSCNYNMEKK